MDVADYTEEVCQWEVLMLFIHNLGSGYPANELQASEAFRK